MMQRGLPRPINRKGLPIPYVAKDADHLGDKDFGRGAEVAKDWLCQVCGDPVGETAFAVMSTKAEIIWPSEWVLDHGLLHEPCLRLALDNCPALVRWEGKRLLRVRRSDVTLTSNLQLEIPAERHDELEALVDVYREPTDVNRGNSL
jgi:hypothetical protein